MKDKILLKGSSGINIYFYTNSEGIKIVRKETANQEQIIRLKTQYKKHLFLRKQENNLFHVPEVLNKQQTDGLFFYEYKFIEGSSMVQNLFTKPTKELIPLMDKLVLIIKYFSSQNKYYESAYKDKELRDVLKEKILSVSSRIKMDKITKDRLLVKLESLKAPQGKTLSHGDLSFDNIIVDKKNNIWLIDYIGTFYPHYWLDIAKLFQDIEGKWYQLKHGGKVDKKKLDALVKHLKREVSVFDKDYQKSHNFLMSTVFLRILPYLKSKSEKDNILKKINHYLEK